MRRSRIREAWNDGSLGCLGSLAWYGFVFLLVGPFVIGHLIGITPTPDEVFESDSGFMAFDHLEVAYDHPRLGYALAFALTVGFVVTICWAVHVALVRAGFRGKEGERGSYLGPAILAVLWLIVFAIALSLPVGPKDAQSDGGVGAGRANVGAGDVGLPG